MTNSIIGTKKLHLVYSSAARHFLETQLHAQTILQQSFIDVSNLDSALATKIKHYQNLMKQISGDYTVNLLRKLINVISKTDDFCDLSKLFIEEISPKLILSTNNEQIRNEILNSCIDMENEINQLLYDISFLIDQLTLTYQSFSEFQDKYNEELTSLIEFAEQSLKELVKEIDKVIAEKKQNIENIISGANQVGEGIFNLGIGILTELENIPSYTIIPIENKNNKEQPNSDNDTKNIVNTKMVDLSFAITAIQLSATGMGASLEAGNQLQANNKKLAQLFQKMAQQESILTIGKVIQVQNQFFYSSFELSQSDSSDLTSNWDKIKDSFSNLKLRIQEISNQNEAQILETEIKTSVREWDNLTKIIKNIKRNFTG